MSDRDNGSSVIWFLAGLGVGALAGVLYAPRSGSETRQAILDAADDSRDFMKNRGQQTREQVTKLTSRGKEVLNQQKDQFKSAFEAGRQAYREATTEKP